MGRLFEWVAVVHRDVCVLSGFERSDALFEAKDLGGVDGDQGEGVAGERPLAAAIAASNRTTRVFGT